MGKDSEMTLGSILWELMLALTRLEAVAELGNRYMREHGLEDKAMYLWNLYTDARDWLDEVMSWVQDVSRG